MELKMTERDKKLIVFLALFVIVVAGGYWGVYPLVKGMINTRAEITSEQAKKDANDVKIAQLSMLEVENSKLEEEILDVRSNYFEMMTSDEVDKYMTNLMLSYNLTAYDLSITMPEDEAEVTPYQYSAKADELEKEEEEKKKAEASTEETTEETSKGKTNKAIAEVDEYTEDSSSALLDIDPETGIYCVNVIMRVGGTEANMNKVIDYLSNSESKIHLVSYSWGSERAVNFDDDGDYEIEEQKTLTMSVNLYMCEE